MGSKTSNMGRNRFLAITLSLVLIAGFASPAFGSEVLYMVSKGSDTNDPSQLYTLDTSTGIATPLANPVGFTACTAMDFESGVLYAACELFSDQNNRLISINPFTGIGADIGANGGGFNYAGMSAQPSTGTMFTYQTVGGDGLGTFNLGTGLYTAIDTNSFTGGNGMAFSAGGTLFIARANGTDTDSINTVNLSNGDETESADIAYEFPLGEGNKTNAMDFSASGTLWATIKNQSPSRTSDAYLVTINPATGAMNTPLLIKFANDTVIKGVDGIAFLDDQEVGGSDVSVNTSALLLAGAQSSSMWMIPVILAGIGIGIFVIKRRN